MKGKHLNSIQIEETNWIFNYFGFLFSVLGFCYLWQGEQHHNSHFSCVLFSSEYWSHITVLIHISQTCNRIFRPILFSNFIIYSYLSLSLWWVDHGRLADPHPATPSLPLLNRTGGENKMEKLVHQDKDRQIADQLLSQAKQTWLRQN